MVVDSDKMGKKYEQTGVEEGEINVQTEKGNIEVKTAADEASSDTAE